MTELSDGSPTSLARAKINLALHVVGLEPDGYHSLDTLVAFAGFGDKVTVKPADQLRLTVSGPYAAGIPVDGSNLVVKAARHLADMAKIERPGASINLEKNLPSAAGIGGGSADAAETLKLLAHMWDIPVDVSDISRGIGADVPMCFAGRPARARGVGDRLDAVPTIPALTVVLINPGVPISTPVAFQGLLDKNNPPLPNPDWSDAASLVQWLENTRNDLEAPATIIVPVIADITSSLRQQDGCLFARMSGSGATCFGLFNDPETADRALQSMQEKRGVAWAVSAPLDGQNVSGDPRPRV